MSRRPATNTAASVRRRLLNLSRATGRSFNEVVQHYALERWLYRLSRSEHAASFVLKGALLLRVWDVPAARATRDIDLLARTSNDPDAVRRVVAGICGTTVEPDGMAFDHTRVTAEHISEDAHYKGVRATFRGLLGTVRCAMQIDMGFSDVVSPAPVEIDYPTLLGLPSPHLWAYNRETAIAEKLEAMVKIGELNSRMKDFFDVWTLSASGDFTGAVLAEAVAATFSRRGTVMDPSAVCFRRDYAHHESKGAQWRAFVRRVGLQDAPESFPHVWESVMAFLRPVVDAVALGKPFPASWPPGGPWVPEA